MNRELLLKTENVLKELDARFNFELSLKELQNEIYAQNWCGEGCRNDCKGGGFFD